MSSAGAEQDQQRAGVDAPVDRPEFMEVLGLLPPYSIEDVHKAYKARAREAHPDQGGSPAEFMKLRQAYGQAQEYMSFRAGRREWMSYLVEPYIKQQELVEEVRRRGGDVRMESIDWMKKSYGDFAALTERLGRITLRNAADADAFLAMLHRYRDQLKHLTELDLSGSTITAAGTAVIGEIKSLKRVNLSGTPVSAAMLKPLAALPDLAWLGLAGCQLGIAGPLRVRLRLPRVKIGWE